MSELILGAMLRRVLLVFLIAGVGHADGELRLHATFDLSELLKEERQFLGVGQHSVFALAFSPDEGVLAVAAGFHDTQEGPRTHVIVFSIPEGKKKFDKTIPTSSVTTLKWSSDGLHLLVQGSDGSWMLALDGGEDCHVGDWSTLGGFVSATTFLVAHNAVSTTSLTFYDAHCNRVSEAAVSERARTLDTENQMIALSGGLGDVHILRGPTWKTYAVLTDPRTGLTVRLLEQGKSVCAGRAPGPGDSTFRCWALDGPAPRQISTWPSKRAGTEPSSSAAIAPLILFKDMSFSYNAFTERSRNNLRRWVLWDARRGVIADQLRGKSQTRRFSGEAVLKFLAPWASELSASGKLAAIGGDNAVEIYTVGNSAE